MDGDDIFVGILLFVLACVAIYGVVFLPLDIYFDSGASTACKLQGYDGGYRSGIALGQDICKLVVQEEIIEYHLLK